MNPAFVWKNICKSFPILSDKIGYPGEIRGIFVHKLMFIVLLHRTIKYVIPRKGEALTWESPAPQFKFVQPN